MFGQLQQRKRRSALPQNACGVRGFGVFASKAAGAVLSFVNLAFMGFGADVYGAGTLKTGLIFAALIVPVFVYRHYIQDKGSFPQEMADDLDMVDGERIVKRAGIWPYVVLVLGIAVVAITHRLAVY